MILAFDEMVFDKLAFNDSLFGKTAFGFFEFGEKVFESSNSINSPVITLETFELIHLPFFGGVDKTKPPLPIRICDRKSRIVVANFEPGRKYD